jgi:hypothetical protein
LEAAVSPSIRTIVITLAAGAALLNPGLAHALPYDEWGTGDAYYSPNITTIQAASPAGLRTFLSTDQHQYTEQSFVWGGPLYSSDGGTSVVCVEMQRDDTHVGPFGILAEGVTAGVLYNDGDGYAAGGFSGLAEVQLPVNFTRFPWSVRATNPQASLSQPEYVDVRAVSGAVGAKGTIYEITASVVNVAQTAPLFERLDIYVRAKDTTGIMQWGYGPSGFAPMWVFPDQRAAIENDYDGSVIDYLQGTDDSMWSQGQYYFTSPMLKVEKFVIQKDGAVVDHGTAGWLWTDNVVRSFTPEANEVTHGAGGIGWNEFGVAIPATGEAFKIGYTESDDTNLGVGTFPYAYLVSPDGPRAHNGALSSAMSWGINDVHMTPVKNSRWTNPATGNSYYLTWKVVLDKNPRGTKVKFTIKQAVPNQEAVIVGRSVFEGVTSVKGTIGKRSVTGWAFQEFQQPGKGL